MDHANYNLLFEIKEYQKRKYRFQAIFAILVIFPTCLILSATAVMYWIKPRSLGDALKEFGLPLGSRVEFGPRNSNDRP